MGCGMNFFGGRMRDEPFFHCEMQGAWVDPYIFLCKLENMHNNSAPCRF